MDYYIQTDGPTNKAAYIIKNYGAREVLQNDINDGCIEDQGVIVVVSNGPFEAAAYIYSKEEFRNFTLPEDRRRKTFLIMDKSTAEKLSRYTR